MLHPLINHNADLKQLWDEGYELEVRSRFLLVHHIPYVDNNTNIRYGTLVTALELSGEVTNKPQDHVIYFIGEIPCDKSGTRINGIYHSGESKNLGNDIITNHSFSNKPKGGYDNYYHKVSNYANIISAYAKSIDENVTEKTFGVMEPSVDESVFRYHDTNSTNAEIDVITDKVKGQKICIIGVGGTGSYILDLIAKTPVNEIHLYDGDLFYQNNAFRAPGAPSIETLKQRINKAVYFKNIYDQMRQGIFAHDYFVDETNLKEIIGTNFVFLCVDIGSKKKTIVNFLQENDISFIDVGMGLQISNDSISGIARITTSTQDCKEHVHTRVSFTDDSANEYSKNIQIADLNSLNASLAVIKWKKINGIYHNPISEHFTVYNVDTGDIYNDEYTS